MVYGRDFCCPSGKVCLTCLYSDIRNVPKEKVGERIANPLLDKKQPTKKAGETFVPARKWEDHFGEYLMWCDLDTGSAMKPFSLFTGTHLQNYARKLKKEGARISIKKNGLPSLRKMALKPRRILRIVRRSSQ